MEDFTLIEVAIFYPEYRAASSLYMLCAFVLAFDMGLLAKLISEWWERTRK